MILNERAYKIAGAAAERFRTAIAKAEAESGPPGAAARAAVGAMRTQLQDLERERAAYERMKNGKAAIDPAPIGELGQLFIQARIARGWTQRQLGDRIGIKEQAVQAYEQNGYVRASLTRLQEVALALGANVTASLELVRLPAEFTETSLKGSARNRKRRTNRPTVLRAQK